MHENGVDVADFRRAWFIPVLVAVLVAVIDQLAKLWIWRTMGPVEGASTPLIDNWLRLTLVFNTGVAFGFFRGFPFLFTILPMLISAGAAYFYWYHLPHHRPVIQVCIGMILGGAVGNIIDRLRLGYVIDFIHVVWFPGIFNLADSAITLGVVFLALYLLISGDDVVPHDTSANNPPLRDMLHRD